MKNVPLSSFRSLIYRLTLISIYVSWIISWPEHMGVYLLIYRCVEIFIRVFGVPLTHSTSVVTVSLLRIYYLVTINKYYVFITNKLLNSTVVNMPALCTYFPCCHKLLGSTIFRLSLRFDQTPYSFVVVSVVLQVKCA